MMVTVKAITSVLWLDRYWLDKDGNFEMEKNVAEIYQSHGSLEILDTAVEELPQKVLDTFNEEDIALKDDSFRLSDLENVDEELELELQEIGIYNLEDLKASTVDDLVVIKGVGKKTARKILGEVK